MNMKVSASSASRAPRKQTSHIQFQLAFRSPHFQPEGQDPKTGTGTHTNSTNNLLGMIVISVFGLSSHKQSENGVILIGQQKLVHLIGCKWKRFRVFTFFSSSDDHCSSPRSNSFFLHPLSPQEKFTLQKILTLCKIFTKNELNHTQYKLTSFKYWFTFCNLQI